MFILYKSCKIGVIPKININKEKKEAKVYLTLLNSTSCFNCISVNITIKIIQMRFRFLFCVKALLQTAVQKKWHKLIYFYNGVLLIKNIAFGRLRRNDNNIVFQPNLLICHDMKLTHK